MLRPQTHLFNLESDVTYLNCAYMSPLARPVVEAGTAGLLLKERPYRFTTDRFFQPVRDLRASFARLINCPDPHRIALVPAVSYGMAVVARNLEVRAGQNIVVVHEQFPSNYYPWERFVRSHGTEIRTVRPGETLATRGSDWNERLLAAIDADTALVAVPHVHWADGTRYDLKTLRTRTHEVGALLVVDGTQSVGALPFDVQDLGVDALVCGAYKWLLGPYGSGLAYFGERFDDGIPVEENWINRLDSDNFANLVRYQPRYQPLAQRYNTGETSNFINVPMLNAALDLLHTWTPAGIQAYCEHLLVEPLEALTALGYQIAPAEQRAAHLFGLRLPTGLDLDALRQRLVTEKISVSVRGNAVRISPHVYNTATDMERLVAVLRSMVVADGNRR